MKQNFFRVRRSAGRWWLVAPDGSRFISKGVTSVRFDQDRIMGTDISPYGRTNAKKYGTPDAWRRATAGRLLRWGFNTLGAWSDEAVAAVQVRGRRLAYAPILNLGAAFVSRRNPAEAWLHGIFPDVFDPRFEATAYAEARRKCAPRAGDPWLLGWFTDNEMRWGADWRGSDDLLTMFLRLPAGAPGRKAALAAKGDRELFLTRLADRYFRITRAAVRAADPNHMIFGCRFAYVPPPPVAAAAAKYLDAVSLNCYEPDPRAVIAQYVPLGRPLIIGEYSFRADDSGLYNTKGAGPLFRTQAQRAAAFEKYVTLALGNPSLVGYHWFEHADEPKEGRSDGENSNYGVVNIKDEVYATLTRRMTRVNAAAEAMHARASTAPPRPPAVAHAGPLTLAGATLPCYVLDDGRRVLARNRLTQSLTGQATAVRATHGGRMINVLPAEALIASAGGARAAAILAACARDGLEAMIDEATGAMYAALPAPKLAPALRRWERSYPRVLWDELARLAGRAPQPRPACWDHLVEELVYRHLDADVIAWLRAHRPIPLGQRDYQRWLAAQYGLKKTVEHIWGLAFFSKMSGTILELRRRMASRRTERIVHQIRAVP